MVLVLNDADVVKAARWGEKTDTLAEVFADWGNGAALSGPRMDYHLLLADGDGRPEEADAAHVSTSAAALLDFRHMFGLWPRRHVAALRIVNGTWRFPVVDAEPRSVLTAAARAGRVPAFVLVFDARTGELQAVIADAVLQRDRVVCTGAVGVRLLARSDACTLGLLGAGNMAAGYLAAIASDRALRRVLVYSPNPVHRRRFADNSAWSGIDIQPVDRPEAAASADIVCAATNARHPVVQREWLSPGSHVVITNLHEPADDLISSADRLVITCHDRVDGWQLAGQCLPGESDAVAESLGGAWGVPLASHLAARIAGAPDLGDLFAGHAPARTDHHEITCHVNQSAGLQFAAIAWIVARNARESGIGIGLPDQYFTTVAPDALPLQPADSGVDERSSR